MKLWAVFNGYMADGAVCALIEAETEAAAIAKAPAIFATDRYQGDRPEYCKVRGAEEIKLPALVELG